MKVPMGPPPLPRKQNPSTSSSSSPLPSTEEAYDGVRHKSEEERVRILQEEAKVSMGPPPLPPQFSSPSAEPSLKGESESTVASSGMAETNQVNVSQTGSKVPVGPPPPRVPDPAPQASSDVDGGSFTAGNSVSEEAEVRKQEKEEEERAEGREVMDKPTADKNSVRSQLAAPYVIPPWSETPGNPFYLEILKDGAIIGQLDVSEKGAYMFGRVDICDFVLEHPTISRFHAVLQYGKDSGPFIYDLGSTHGTFLNKHQIKKKTYTELCVGDIIRFGQSTRLYIFQGPSEFMPPEGNLKKLRNIKIREEMKDREASLLRAKAQAAMEDGISWGMAEDAPEDISEMDAEEITWQNYKGQLTERQEKTRGKIIKRMEKVANMRKEIDSIRVKDISQGGLTQGQQTQIARNEQRMAQILEELDSLEETLNDSIQESMGARAKTTHGKKKGSKKDEDEDDMLSDDDEFYDRTKKAKSKKFPEQQVVETAETLLDKKDVLVKEMEEKTKLLQEERSKMTSIMKGSQEESDELDAYMTGLSSKLVLDKTTKIEGELSALQSELDRILYLLKIADPNGESAKKRELKKVESCPTPPQTKIASEPKKIYVPEKPPSAILSPPPISLPEEESSVDDKKAEAKTQVYSVPKPQWLGAVKEKPISEEQEKETVSEDVEASDEFVDYKDRKVLVDGEGLENAEAGLIIRKKKQVENPKSGKDEGSSDAESTVADAVALLLKHKRGYVASEDEIHGGDDVGVKEKKAKRVLGPEKPSFLEKNTYETWMPPEGQSGDGRTSLNDRLGY